MNESPSMNVPTQATRYTLQEWVRQRDLAAIFQGTDNLINQRAFVAILTDVATRDRRVLDEMAVELALLRTAGPPLITVLDYNVEQMPLYAMTEVVEGISLRQLVDAAGRGLPPTEALAYCADAARCLQALHNMGMAHGSVYIDSFVLRASNLILVTPWVDSIFGADLFATTDIYTQRETPDYHVYVSPERAAGRSSGVAADVYALGILLFHLLTGVAPGVAPGNPEVAPWLSGGKTPPLGESITDATVRARLQKLIQIATSPDPMRRWPDIKSFLAALDQIKPGGTGGLPRISSTMNRIAEGAPVPPPSPNLYTDEAMLPGASESQPPVVAQPPAQPQTCYLVSPASGAVYMANAPRASVGAVRNASFVPDVDLAMEPAEQAQYVSQHHLDLIYDRGQWYVQPSMVARNPTFLNGQQVYPGTSQPLADGAELEIPALRLQCRFNTR